MPWVRVGQWPHCLGRVRLGAAAPVNPTKALHPSFEPFIPAFRLQASDLQWLKASVTQVHYDQNLELKYLIPGNPAWGSPKIRGPFSGVSITRTVAFWRL